MSVAARLATFATLLVVAFAVGLLIGDAAGPIDTGPTPAQHAGH